MSQFILCPRCKFRLPASKQLCSTCGMSLASKKNSVRGINDELGSAPKTQSSFWKTFLGLSQTSSDSQKENNQEEPVLS